MSTNIVKLSKFEPGKLPLEVFNGIAHLTVTPVMELLVISEQTVLLSRRANTDQYWPNQYSIPGSIIYSGGPKSLDEYAGKILARLDINTNANPRLKGIELCSTRRGDEIAIVYRIDIDSIPNLDNHLSFVELKDLSELDIISEHREILQKYLIG